MPNLSVEERDHIRSAFELAYFIIPDKGIALGVAEESCHLLDSMLGKQDRTRLFYKQLLGFVKWEEKSRPLRTKISLNQEHMLQWIVYYQCESWERATEYGSSRYAPGAEDLVVRYIKHLVRITLNRNSFYVTLAITRLLHIYTTHEVRLMYDVLTASDSARMKDTNYLRKQKAMLMDQMIMRFHGQLQEQRVAHGEKRFEPQATTGRLIYLVTECLRRFTPWSTSCVIQEGVDPTAIPELYYSGKRFPDEDRVEMSRIHTVLHPECFARLVNGLSLFINRLPLESPDKSCSYDSPDERLAVPRFRKVNDVGPLDDRFSPPQLNSEDYQLLQRTRETLRRRRKTFQPGQLSVYVDDVELASFDTRRTNGLRLEIGPEAGVVEVRGDDLHEELLLAALIVCCEDIPDRGSFKDWTLLERGQKITIRMSPIRSAEGDLQVVSIEVSYAETRLMRAALSHARWIWQYVTDTARSDREGLGVPHSSFSALGKAGAIFVILLSIFTFMWVRFLSQKPTPAPAPRVEVPQPPNVEVPPQAPPAVPSVKPPIPEQTVRLIASIGWVNDSKAAGGAVRLETVRGEIPRIEIPRDQKTLVIAIPGTDANHQDITQYRITLLEAGKAVWRQAIRPPGRKTTGYARVMNLGLSSQLRNRTEPQELQFEGFSQTDWQPLGSVRIEFIGR